MRQSLPIALILCLVQPVMTGAAHATTDPRESDRQTVIAGERAWGQAFVTGNVETIQRLLADDFQGVGPRGDVYSKADMLKDVAEGPNGTADSVEDIRVRFYGDTAVAQAREHEVGPPPERKSAERVFTDTWIKQGGQWKIVAAEDLDPGAATPPAFAAERGVIIALRARSNRAIAAHDLAAFSPVFADDAVFVWSNGSSAVGRADLEGKFRSDFADPTFDRYIRTPETVAISDAGVRAVEHGTWTALKRNAQGETRYGGDYAAHWFKGADGWRIRGELYVKLHCTGPQCQP